MHFEWTSLISRAGGTAATAAVRNSTSSRIARELSLPFDAPGGSCAAAGLFDQWYSDLSAFARFLTLPISG
jgi:hypothetical protein